MSDIDIVTTDQSGVTIVITNESGPRGIGFYSQIGVPFNTFGADGEGYLDVSTGFLYTKYAGIWNFQRSIIGPVGRVNFQTEIITLNSFQIGAKEVTLSSTPTAQEKTTVEIQYAPTQAYGVDFIVVGNKISWTGLSFELLLEVGSILTIRYYN